MPDRKIDKVRFRKRDIIALHDLPSANPDKQILVRGHHPRHWTGSALRWVLGVALVLVLAVGGLLAALEAGVVDGFVRDRARIALAQAVGDENRSELSSVGVRLTSRGQLALVARDVLVERKDGSSPANRIDSVLISLDPLALLTGKISLTSVDVSGAGFAAPEGDGFNLTDLAGFRVDATGTLIEQLFSVLNRIAAQVDAVEASAFRFSDILIFGTGTPILIESAEVRRLYAHNYEIEADIVRSDHAISLRGTASGPVDTVGLSDVEGTVEGFTLEFLTEGSPDRQNGVSAPLDISFSASRATEDKEAALSVRLGARDGTITMGGIHAALRDAQVRMVYMPNQNKIEITPSIIRIGETVLPFTGGLIDADQIEKTQGAGIAFDFVIRKGLAAPGDSDEAPISFDGKAFGRFNAARRMLVAEELALSTPQGVLFGSASWRFVEGISPEINLVAQTEQMSTAAVKQFWPYWVGKRARQWVLDNLYGGTLSNGRIQLSAPAGHYKPFGTDAAFDENQLQIDFDIERARMNVTGDIPPLRDTSGHMRLRGTKISFNIDSATAFFPTNRTVEISDAIFTIPASNEQPLMAELDMSVSGNAAAVAELITYHPINALDQIGLKPEELDGEVSSKVTARFGLIAEQSPPPPEWTVDLKMSDVDVAKPVEGRVLTQMNGSLFVTPEQATLKADALVDGALMTLDVLQPVGESGVAVQRKLSGTLSPEAREKLAPGTSALISGPVGFMLDVNAEGGQAVKLDLKPAKLTVPGIGWTKDKGIAATLQFLMQSDGDETRLSSLTLSGDGFKASGEVLLKDGELSTADFDHVMLSSRDDYHVAVARKGAAYQVEIGGKAIDVRPLIAQAKSVGTATPEDKSNAVQVEVSGSVDAVHGYSDEKLSSGSIRYRGKGDRIDLLDFKAVTKSGQALVMAVMRDEAGESVEITSGDAGAFARFAGVYSRIQGGLLNIRLKSTDSPVRSGVIDVRNFVIAGEPRLSSLVSTPSKKDGKSLKDAVKADINVSKARFEVANARVVSGNGELRISEGIIRGPELGASFQGKVLDSKGNMDMTGTFMPAYGLNRLFGELPVIGLLLGNGRDRGLIGITFRLAGKTDSPLLQVNPLSVIAPGVFRSIFEYRR